MRALALALVFLSLSTPACNKDEPKKVSEEPKKATPVPSDMVLNDFLPEQGGPKNLAVRGADGGLEGGLAAMAGGGDAGEAAPAADAASELKVTEPGAEPRAIRKYTFTPNKTERRVIVLRQTISQGPQKQEQPALSLTMDLTPKAAKPNGSTPFEMKIVSVEIADKDKVPPQLRAQLAQITEQLKGFTGMAATFEVDPRGAVGEVTLKADKSGAKEGAEEILSAFQQAVELMLPPFPQAPIGVGAKWERNLEEKQMGLSIKSKHAFELKDLSGDGGTVVAAIEQKVPKRQIPDPRARGASVEIDGSGKYTYAFRFDRIATKVEGELVRKETIEVPGEGGKKETISRETKIAHTMTEPAAK